MLDRPTLFLAGTAGSGKSSLAGALRGWLGDQGLPPAVINLDPGADTLPYEPDVDIREWVHLPEIMRDTGLGPNGAQIAAADMIAVNLQNVEDACAGLRPDVYIIDTPGQLELFAFRASGPFVVSQLSHMPVLAFLLDPVVAQKPRGLISQLLLATTVHFRLQAPTVNVLSKIDALQTENLKTILHWLDDHDALMDALDEEPATMDTQLNRSVARTLEDFSAIARTIPTSSNTLEGFEDLYELITNLFAGGEGELPG